ncbi:uncharacterized protein [Euphorbia lathyris]|uniref:uncharacterized protein n=1 Tax=Euphorbia lathyris TaxID=212925 RepID=UPI0033138142
MSSSSTLFHVRSESLPTRPHPIIADIDDQISRLRSLSEATNNCSSSSTSLVHQLNGLQDLHDSVDKLLLLPLTQHLFSQQNNKKLVEELLDGSLRLLDICNTSKDALLQSKEYALQLESTLRRRQSSFHNEVTKYLTSRKMAKKAIHKSFNNLKSLHVFSSIPNNSSNEISSIIGILREVQAITLSILKSFMSFVNGRRLLSSGNKWSLVTKIMIQKRIGCDEESDNTNEFAKVDAALESMVGSNNKSVMENEQTLLKDLELCIHHLEDGTQTLFRRMIKTRVSLLNSFN